MNDRDHYSRVFVHLAACWHHTLPPPAFSAMVTAWRSGVGVFSESVHRLEKSEAKVQPVRTSSPYHNCVPIPLPPPFGPTGFTVAAFCPSGSIPIKMLTLSNHWKNNGVRLVCSRRLLTYLLHNSTCERPRLLTNFCQEMIHRSKAFCIREAAANSPPRHTMGQSGKFCKETSPHCQCYLIGIKWF